MSAGFMQNRSRVIAASTATSPDAKFLLQASKARHARRSCVADLLVSNGVTDADVHDFNNLGLV